MKKKSLRRGKKVPARTRKVVIRGQEMWAIVVEHDCGYEHIVRVFLHRNQAEEFRAEAGYWRIWAIKRVRATIV